MTGFLFFLCRHGLFVSFHPDTMPFAGFFNLPLPFGFGSFADSTPGFGFTGDDIEVSFGFFRFTAPGKRDYQDCGRDGDEDGGFHFCSPVKGYKRVFPFARSAGRLKKELNYGC
jgi:hypothetical protein